MSLFADITIDSIIKDIDKKKEEVKASNKSSKEKEDIVFGLEIAKQVVANYY
jgi:hypothetical protein